MCGLRHASAVSVIVLRKIVAAKKEQPARGSRLFELNRSEAAGSGELVTLGSRQRRTASAAQWPAADDGLLAVVVRARAVDRLDGDLAGQRDVAAFSI